MNSESDGSAMDCGTFLNHGGFYHGADSNVPVVRRNTAKGGANRPSASKAGERAQLVCSASQCGRQLKAPGRGAGGAHFHQGLRLHSQTTGEAIYNTASSGAAAQTPGHTRYRWLYINHHQTPPEAFPASKPGTADRAIPDCFGRSPRFFPGVFFFSKIIRMLFSKISCNYL